MFGQNGQDINNNNAYTYFADGKPNGYTHYIEWSTPSPILLKAIRLFGTGDGPGFGNEREIAKFVLKTKSLGSATFDKEIFVFSPTHPYTFLDPANLAILDTEVPPTLGQFFRAEFVQYNGGRGFDGPRVMELDGFGEVGLVPKIATQPLPLEVEAGAAASFTVEAGGTEPLTYQWYFKDAEIPGATGKTLLVEKASSATAGAYRAKVSNAFGSVLSDPANLTLKGSPIVYASSDDLWDVAHGVTMTAHSDFRAGSGDPLGMFGKNSHVIDNDNTYTYFADGKPAGYTHFVEWSTPGPVSLKKVRLFATGDTPAFANEREFDKIVIKTKSDGSSSFDKVVLSFTPTHPYTFLGASRFLVIDADVEPVVGREFRAEFSQFTAGRGFDGPRIMELDGFGDGLPDTAPPVINTQPVSLRAVLGSDASLSVEASGLAPLSYQWSLEGKDLDGANGATLKISPVSQASVGTYKVRVANPNGSVLSEGAALTLQTVVSIKQSSVDLFDVTQGTRITASSGVYAGSDPYGMFGGKSPSSELGTTIFADNRPDGFRHFVEWTTPLPINLKSISLFARQDPEVYRNERHIAQFVLKGRATLTEDFKTIYSFSPSIPYQFVDGESFAILAENITPVVAQYFRAEFVQQNRGRGFDGPRVMELDGFGEVVHPADPTIADWTFEEGEIGQIAGVVVDQSGHHHDSSAIIGAPRFVASASGVGGGVSLNLPSGGNAFRVADSEELNLKGEFTLEMSLKPGSDNDTWHRGLLVGQNAATGTLRFGLDYYGNERVVDFFVLKEDGTQTFVPGTIPNDGKSHHVAGVYSNQDLTLFVDGKNVGTAHSSFPAGIEGAGAKGRVTIGSNDIGGYWFNGVVDRARISRKALAPAEFFTPPAAPTSDTVADWTFEEGTIGQAARKIVDQSAHGHDSSAIIGTPKFVATASGIEGKVSLDLPSGGNAFRVGDSVDFNLKTEFTLEMSLKPGSDNDTWHRGLIVGQNPSTGGLTYGIDYYGNEHTAYFFIARADGANFFVPGVIPLDGKSHHIAGVYLNQDLTFYVDGRSVGSVHSTFAAGVATAGAKGRITIGANDGGGYWFNGVIDRVRISRNALTPASFFNRVPESGLPVIATQPASQILAAGETASFAVEASGPPPLTYQWYFNGHEITGANSSVLSIPNVQAANEGSYTVRVKNDAGSVTSGAANLALKSAVSTGVIADWTFEEGKLGDKVRVVRDSSGNSHDSTTIFGKPQWVATGDGADGHLSLALPAGGNAFRVGESSQLNLRDAFTMEVSLLPGKSNGTWHRGVVVGQNPATGRLTSVIDYFGDDHTVNFSVSSQSGESVYVPGVVPQDGKSHHVAGVYESRKLSLYVDGALVGTTTSTFDAGVAAPAAEGVVTVGANASGGYWFDGVVDRVRISGKALAPSEFFPTGGRATAPAILTSPASLTVAPGAPAAFSVVANGSAPLQYQWSFNGVPIENATSSSFLIAAAEIANAGVYTVKVSNSAGSAESDPAALKVSVDTAIISISRQPQGQTVDLGSPVLFAVTASSSEALSYQWLLNGNALGGATAASFRIDSAKDADAGVYTVRISNAHTAVLSDGATLAVNTVTALGPVVVTQPHSQFVELGQTATFDVVATSATPVKYQWRHNGVDIAGANQSALLVQNVQAANAGTYTVFLDNGVGTTLSAGGVLNIVDHSNAGTVIFSNHGIGVDAPVFDVDGVSKLSGSGFLAQLYGGPSETALQPVGAAIPFRSGTAAGYFNDSIPRVIGSVGPGAEATLQVRAWEIGMGETYEAAVAAGAKHGASPSLVLTTGGGPTPPPPLAGLKSFSLVSAPRIDSQPKDLAVLEGEPASFSVRASGPGTLAYQWKLNGQALPGATAANLEIAACRVGDEGDYTVVVSNDTGSVTSQVAHLKVNVADHVAPEVVILAPVAGITAEEHAVLSGTASDNTGIKSLRWERDGQPMGELALVDGHFSAGGLTLAKGPNKVRVVARDAAGNEGASEVVVTWAPPRVIVLSNLAARQEGSLVSFPIELTTDGDVAAMTLAIQYNPVYLSAPEFKWQGELETAFNQVNLDKPGEVTAAFALPGVPLEAGTKTIAIVTMRARSVPANVETQIGFQVAGVYNSAGDPITSGTYVQGGSIFVTKRKVVGDNNANDRLDVGDATLIMRLVTKLDAARDWDVAGNDLNKNSDLDSGDVIRVLRAVVGLDPQPVVPQNAGVGGLHANSVGSAAVALADGAIVLKADKLRAAPGETVKVQAVLASPLKALTGASFKLEYPVKALKLLNAQAHQVGAIVPTSALALWNVSPSQNNYATQDGKVSVAFSTASPWPNSDGVLAEFTFTVQAEAAGQYLWPIKLSGLEVSSGFDVAALGGASVNFTGRDSVPASLSPVVERVGDTLSFSLRGEIGVRYQIEGSGDLTHWTPVSTQTSPDGSIHFTDPQAVGETQRFYRARQLD